MSIIHEVYAVCDGCGCREQLEETASNVPDRWTRLIDGASERGFCSTTCVAQFATGGLRSRPGVPSELPYGVRTSELRVLELVALGYTNKEVARKLGVAESTVKNNLTNVLHKLHAGTRVEGVLLAYRVGLLNLPTLLDRVGERLAA